MIRIENEKWRLTIERDDYCEDGPREWDNLGTMVYGHGRYVLGDEEAQNTEKYISWDQWLSYEVEDLAVALPLYLYDHSGLRMNTTGFNHLGWHGYFDSGQVGWIYVTSEKLKEEGIDVEKAEEILRGEIETFDQWLSGDVYGFILEEKKLECEAKECPECGYAEPCEFHSEIEYHQVDSCWGYYGTDFENNGILETIPDELHEQLIKEGSGQRC